MTKMHGVNSVKQKDKFNVPKERTNLKIVTYKITFHTLSLVVRRSVQHDFLLPDMLIGSNVHVTTKII
jgi:hypothetical protein